MKTIHSILVATDFSPGSNTAVARAVQLAKAHHASLGLLHAFDSGIRHSLHGVFDPRNLGKDPPPDVQMRRQVEELAATLGKQSGLSVDAHFGAGAPEVLIARQARAQAASLVVIGSAADPRATGLGGTAWKTVLSDTGCPILIVRAAEPHPLDRVICAVDLSDASLRAASFALALFPTAKHQLLYALERPVDTATPRATPGRPRRHATDGPMHARAADELQQLARRLSTTMLLPLDSAVADDDAGRAILEAATALPADCVCIGRQGEAAAVGAMPGHVAEQVILHAPCDVLVVP